MLNTDRCEISAWSCTAARAALSSRNRRADPAFVNTDGAGGRHGCREWPLKVWPRRSSSADRSWGLCTRGMSAAPIVPSAAGSWDTEAAATRWAWLAVAWPSSRAADRALPQPQRSSTPASTVAALAAATGARVNPASPARVAKIAADERARQQVKDYEAELRRLQRDRAFGCPPMVGVGILVIFAVLGVGIPCMGDEQGPGQPGIGGLAVVTFRDLTASAYRLHRRLP